ncbi:cellulose synthase/poly-beta-1,6-N-acetylglucosamine synthase-like glycosyltransferase [Lutibacter oceani]|uniref:Cellulose synthase/poly-beta-1,6-N-acetylglucosamine synthase-like glycosyltransferase n=1 Tax=Lutibacter oceani TaxID=1853311 RepID=A0A3D9RQD6_9FLAO|nr:glycosyltransferase [Lutibacter oceani]REE82153.1 cellulose synthase/poly-beta-1,6-N-acetylglucosamine synthase-like glycosyltransferase [Lutibacter oceani]
MEYQFSIIIPVYNRPQEIDELLQSLTKQTFQKSFEVIVVEDGSTIKADKILKKYSEKLNLKYFFKENSGAGASRNFGMQQASGNYFIIFDSDCIIPPNYLVEVEKALQENYTDAFGGADAAHQSFTTIQKAINYSMTSFFTTGGIRGSKKAVDKFQPRSFNLGISKKAFEVSKGFSKMKIGEDIDLTFRLWEHNFETQFIENAFVYHKRRSTFQQFFKQTFAFGKGRPFLNRKYPETAKLTYWFPSLFILGLAFSIIMMLIFKIKVFALFFATYFIIILIHSFIKNKNINVAIVSILTTLIQFAGYGLGFLKGLLAKN